MKEQKLLLMLSQSLIGTGFFFLYVQHVRSIFESRTNIAHITQLERESLLRQEDALYFSFYKTLTEESDFWTGYEKLKNVTDIEYPNSVNVLQRFHVLPELTIAYLYHLLRRYIFAENFPLFSCWYSNDIRLPIEHRRCDAAGQAMQFYLEFVWLLGGITIFVIYIYGTLLSENIFGGIYAVVSYIMFHSYASRIYDHPMARENFAFPIIFLQMFYLCLCIDRITETKKYTSRLFVTTKLTCLTILALLCWQSTSIIFASQILILMTPWSAGSVSNHVSNTFTLDYALSQLLANVLSYYFSSGNKSFIFAWQIGPAIGLFFMSILRRVKPHSKNNDLSMKTVFLGILMAISAQGAIIDLLEKTGLAPSMDNSFTLYRDLTMHWGLQAKVNFSTSLAACNPAFQRMNLSDLWELIKTLIVKPYCMYGVVMLAKFFRKWRKCGEKKTPSNDYIERAKNYILEDFLEENHISMRDMSNKETENDLNECLKLLEECDYDYERYKSEKSKMKKSRVDEHAKFMNDIKKLKQQINEINIKKNEEEQSNREESAKLMADSNAKSKSKPSKTDNTTQNESNIKNNSNNGSSSSNSSSSSGGNNGDNGSGNGSGSGGNARHVRGNTKRAANTESSNFPSGLAASSAHASANSSAVCRSDVLSFHYLYSFVQMAVFTVIGLSIKKLFFLSFTQGCVIAPTICSKFWYRKQRNIFWTVSLAVFLTSIIDPGMVNIREEYFPTRYTYGSDDLDTMLEWIKMNTEKDAVFAGPVDIIGTVHLVTKRPIVNHAHLEMRHISDRTEHVYSVFSRQQSSDIYTQCSQLKIQYLIISINDCTNEVLDECDVLSIWDDMQPAYRKYPQFCSELANKNIPSFLKVFSNDYYGIIKMFSQSVQINLKYSKMPEKVM